VKILLSGFHKQDVTKLAVAENKVPIVKPAKTEP